MSTLIRFLRWRTRLRNGRAKLEAQASGPLAISRGPNALKDNNEEGIAPKKMLQELCADNLQLKPFLRATHAVCDRHNDVASGT
jgi:hypothetical protein